MRMCKRFKYKPVTKRLPKKKKKLSCKCKLYYKPTMDKCANCLLGAKLHIIDLRASSSLYKGSQFFQSISCCRLIKQIIKRKFSFKKLNIHFYQMKHMQKQTSFIQGDSRVHIEKHKNIDYAIISDFSSN